MHTWQDQRDYHARGQGIIYYYTVTLYNILYYSCIKVIGNTPLLSLVLYGIYCTSALFHTALYSRGVLTSLYPHC